MTQQPPAVRLALPVEAKVIARLQRAAWRADHTPEVADAMEAAVPLAQAEAMWRQAIVAPPLAQFRLMLAHDGSIPVGFAVLGPSADPDATPTVGTVAEFVVDPARRGEGHGSRLMHAVADTLTADGFDTATIWIPTTFDGLRGFLLAHNFATDGAHQELGTDDGVSVKMVRLHTSLA